MSIFSRVADRLIKRAMKTPYFHLTGYMERYWLVPYLEAGTHGGDGVGPVPFLKRPFAWILQRLDIAARVHHILRSDDDRAFHDHPWNFTTIILKGGYWEVRPKFDESNILTGYERTWYGPGSILRRKASDWHILELPEGKTAWTLFITGRYRQNWGFLVTPRAKMPYREYLNLDQKQEN